MLKNSTKNIIVLLVILFANNFFAQENSTKKNQKTNLSNKATSPALTTFVVYQDTDGDGIANNIDVDDDNDGLQDGYEQSSCLLVPYAQSVETIFLDENFGAGNNRVRISVSNPDALTNYCYEDGTTAQATDECNTNINLQDGKYTVHYSINDGDGNTNEISATGPDIATWSTYAWYKGEDHTTGDTTGRMAIFNASHAPGIFYETVIVGTAPNVPINYSFWTINIDNLDSAFSAGELPRKLPNVTVNFYSTDYSTLLSTFNTGDITRCASGNSCSQSIWKQFSTSFTTLQQDFIVQFVNNAPGGNGNDLALDDIKITQTLCDLDGDGISDLFDLDNDNDGIPNIIEAAMIVNPDPDKDATSQGASWVDVNGNGWNDIFEPKTPKDSDSDGVFDYLDLDSDNDGIFDVVEYDGLGDIDINGDGTGDGNDINTISLNDEFDGDGILGIMDTNDADANSLDHGDTGYSTPLDKDSDGFPDYTDLFNNITGIHDIDTTIYSAFDADNDGDIDGSGDSDKDGILNVFDTNDVQFGSPRDLNNKYSLAFDGRNDYVEDGYAMTGLATATIMGFIKLDNSYTTLGTAFGSENFHVQINNSRVITLKVNGSQLVLAAPTALTLNRWTHITATFDGTANIAKVYINGNLIDSRSTSGATIGTSPIFRIGRTPSIAGTDYFKGELDEVRVFNTALTDSQIQKMVYQEIHSTNFARGAIIPIDIPGLASSSLKRYYRMDVYKDDILDNLITPTIDLTGAKIYNVKNISLQTAPVPYVTLANGNWSDATKWVNSSVLDLSMNAWSIVNIKHDIVQDQFVENLGLIIDSSKKLSIINDNEIRNNWYLKLDGKLDLESKSQLVQTANSELDVTSAGVLEREQKGTANLYNYNHWSSPVSSINSTLNNGGFSLINVLKDATNSANILNINWVGGYNGSQSPLSLATFWLYKFQNLSGVYANWTAFTPSSNLEAGTGFTMKGVANNLTGGLQNYAFVGKPNNGTITLPISANNMNLSGNPYPSALDSRQFILDNIDGGNVGSSNSIEGTIYFWQHAPENNSHNLAAYLGGYATLNLVGGVPPMMALGTAGLGTSTKIPNRHIPIGQGFFLKGDASGGNIVFKNSQRAFKLETDNSATGSNTMFRQNQVGIENIDDVETFKKMRVIFQTPNGFEKQILLGFMDNLATDGIDIGYDSQGVDNTPSDFYFNTIVSKLIIQGVGAFDENKVFPLGLKNEINGNIKIKINSAENFTENQEIYLFDNQTNIYYPIKNNEAEINLNAGLYENRFSITFNNGLLSNNNNNNNENSIIVFVDDSNTINVNNLESSGISKIEMFDILGKKIMEQKVEQENLTINSNGLSSGTYLIRMNGLNGIVYKKVLIK